MKSQEFIKIEKTILDTATYKLHCFNTGTGTPILILPPHAGRHGNIAQRMIDTCVSENRTVYAYELLSVTRENLGTDLSGLVNIIHTCVTTINNPVELIGLCQGAWLGAIYTAMYPDNVTKYANFAGPINTKTGQENVIENYMQSYPWGMNIIDYHKLIVNLHNGIQPGYMQWLAFSFVNPSAIYFERWIQLTSLIWEGNDKGVDKWKKNNSWYDSPQDLDGAWFLQAIENHFLNNDIYEGRLQINNTYVDLKNITCDVYLYAGEDDEITSTRQVFDMENVVSGNVTTTLFSNAGHTKVFVGTEELNTFKQQFLKGETK